MLRIARNALRDIYRHAREDYPHECCGFMVGRIHGLEPGPQSVREVTSVVRATNLRTDWARDRYELDPREWMRLERRLDGTGDGIVGIYHSHPDHPSRPSETDRSHAHPSMSYLIVSIDAHRIRSARSWTLNGPDGVFLSEGVERT